MRRNAPVLWTHFGDEGDTSDVPESYFLFFSHVLKLFTDCTESLEVKSFFITSIYPLMKDLNSQLERRQEDFFFCFAATPGSDSVLQIQIRDVRLTSLSSVFRYDFSEPSFHSQESELDLGSTVP